MSDALKTARTTLKRRPDRGAHDLEAIAAVLDRSFLCHLGFVVDEQPFVLPTCYGREGATLYVHGSAASRLVRHLGEGVPVSLAVTELQGIVLARSAFHHSVNYASVMVLGVAEPVPERDKAHALEVITEQIVRGRWRDCRPPTAKELRATGVLRIAIREASLKRRAGPPVDDEADMALPHWAGVLPLSLQAGAPLPDPAGRPETPVPGYLSARGGDERAAG